MSDLQFLTGKDYLSHSSLSTYLGCGHRWYLEKVAGAPQAKAWYLIGGSAFHTASELLDRGEVPDPVTAWHAAWNLHYAMDITEAGIDPADVRAGGRASKMWPDKENAEWWHANGLTMTVDYDRWRQQRFAEGWQWYALPDGTPAIETGIDMVIGSTRIKGYIDRVMVSPDGELCVIDLKTGAHAPASTLQLGIYALGMQHHFGVTPTLGGFYMARKSELTELRSLLHYTPDLVGGWFAAAVRGIEQEVFIPNVTAMCGSCSVKQYCTAFGAPLATASDFGTIATS